MRGSKEFVAVPSRAEHLLKEDKQENESWARYLHVQMNAVRDLLLDGQRRTCELRMRLTRSYLVWQVHRVLVYYTGYKTGQMRRDYAFWTFGVVEIDPNDPSLVVLPNTWKFHEHEPWVRKRANGKDGEWLLRDAYKRGRAPKVFGQQVKEWVSTLRPGSFVAVAVSGVGCLQISCLSCVDPSRFFFVLAAVPECRIRGAGVVGGAGVARLARAGAARCAQVI